MNIEMNLNEIIENYNTLNKSFNKPKIDSIFLEHDGKLEYRFFEPEKLHELRSCSKLLVAMAIGIAIEREMISLETLVYPVIKDIVKIENKDNIEKIKKWNIKNLLTHTTGYEKLIMSVKEIQGKDLDTNNLIEYVLNIDIPYEVGTRFAYNNVEPFILSVFFQEKFGINLSDFINENIFSKLDIREYKWDNYGRYCPGCTGLFLKHTDFHKIAELLLNNGKYNNIQIIPENWIEQMCTAQIETPLLYKSERVLPKISGGYFTFISRDGTNGQYIILNKEENLLITIMASEKEMKNVTEILRGII